MERRRVELSRHRRLELWVYWRRTNSCCLPPNQVRSTLLSIPILLWFCPHICTPVYLWVMPHVLVCLLPVLLTITITASPSLCTQSTHHIGTTRLTVCIRLNPAVAAVSNAAGTFYNARKPLLQVGVSCISGSSSTASEISNQSMSYKLASITSQALEKCKTSPDDANTAQKESNECQLPDVIEKALAKIDSAAYVHTDQVSLPLAMLTTL